MALRIVDGIPRSGKTFYAVRHFAQNFCDLIEDDYYLKDGLTVISNVEGLTLPHIKLDDLIQKTTKHTPYVLSLLARSLNNTKTEEDEKPSLMDFFSHGYQENFIFPKYGPVIYIIDEAQVYFRKNDRTKAIDEVFHWLELHGHFGQDIYLITQSYRKLPTDINIMPEYIIHAVPRSRSMTGEFRYKQIAEGGEEQRKFGIYPDPKIFALYKSASAKETEKVSNPMIKETLVIILGAVMLAGVFGWFIFSRLHPAGSQDVAAEQKSLSAPVMSSAPPGQINTVPVTAIVHEVKPILIPVNYIATTTNNTIKVDIFYNGSIVPVKDFPFKLVQKGKTLFALVDPSLAYLFKPISEPSSKPVSDNVSPDYIAQK